MSDSDLSFETGLKLGHRPCLSCEREHPMSFLVDGWCPQCRGEKPLERPRTESIRQGWLNAAALQRRLSEDRGIKPDFRKTLVEEAELLERRAS
jgi:hypothetical protein